MTDPYDALLLCSFGGPRSREEVIPFLRNVTRGRDVPDDRLAHVAAHYDAVGGRSPINEQNLALRAALAAELDRRGEELPVIWGNRNWHPYSADALRDASAFGARRVLALVTSAYASYSSSRQYREHLADAVAEAGEPALQVDIVRPFFNDPGFLTACADRIVTAAAELPFDAVARGVHIVYVTHSIPETMQRASAAAGPGYAEQHEDVRAVLDRIVGVHLDREVTSSLAYCSRSGDGRTPWLEPDVNDHLWRLFSEGVRTVVLAPIGFVSDHVEVIYDLDQEAVATARALGLQVARAGTVGTHPAFVSGLVDLILERAARERGDAPVPHAWGELGPFPDDAPADGCRMREGEIAEVSVLAGPAD